MRHLFIDREGFTAWHDVDEPAPSTVVMALRIPPILIEGALRPPGNDRRAFHQLTLEASNGWGCRVFVEDGYVSGWEGIALAHIELVDVLSECRSRVLLIRGDMELSERLKKLLQERGCNG